MEKGIIILIVVVFIIIVLVIVGVSVWLVIRNRREEEPIDEEEEEENPNQPPNNPPSNNLCSTYDKDLLDSCKTITIGGHNFPSYTFSERSIKSVSGKFYLWVNIPFGVSMTAHWVDYPDPFFTLENDRLTCLYRQGSIATSYPDGSGGLSPPVWFSFSVIDNSQRVFYDGQNIIFYVDANSTIIYLLRKGYGNENDVVSEAISVSDYVNSALSYIEIE